MEKLPNDAPVLLVEFTTNKMMTLKIQNNKDQCHQSKVQKAIKEKQKKLTRCTTGRPQFLQQLLEAKGTRTHIHRFPRMLAEPLVDSMGNMLCRLLSIRHCPVPHLRMQAMRQKLSTALIMTSLGSQRQTTLFRLQPPFCKMGTRALIVPKFNGKEGPTGTLKQPAKQSGKVPNKCLEGDQLSLFLLHLLIAQFPMVCTLGNLQH